MDHISVLRHQQKIQIRITTVKIITLVLQASDASLRFTYAGNLGYTHDATVLWSSELFQQVDNLIPPGYYILGDSAFPLLGWLVTPFQEFGNLTRDQHLFNNSRNKNQTGQVNERSVGPLKARFPRLIRF